MRPRKEIIKYIKTNVFPTFKAQTDGHGLDHIKYVISNSLNFAEQVKDEPINIDMVYVIAAYHDIGQSVCYETHETESAKMLRADKGLAKFFTSEQLETMAIAIQDHRASSDHEPRNIYGKIVSSADRRWDINDSLKTMYRHSLKHYAKASLDDVIEEIRNYAIKKYGKGGYAVSKMYFKSKQFDKMLKQMQVIVYDKEKFKRKILSVTGA